MERQRYFEGVYQTPPKGIWFKSQGRSNILGMNVIYPSMVINRARPLEAFLNPSLGRLQGVSFQGFRSVYFDTAYATI